MNDYINNITLDLNCNQTPVIIGAGQFDNGRKISVSITANGESFNIIGCTAVCKGVNSDGSHFAKSCTVDSNKVIVTTDESMLAVRGTTAAKIVLSDGTRSYSTQNFVIVVSNAYDGDITASEKYSVLNDLISRVIQITQTGGILLDTEINVNSQNPVSGKTMKEYLNRYSYIYDASGRIVSYSWDNVLTDESFSISDDDKDKGLYICVASTVTEIKSDAFMAFSSIKKIYVENVSGNVDVSALSNDIVSKITYYQNSLMTFYMLASLALLHREKADKTEVYNKSETESKLAVKLNNTNESVHYTNLAGDVFGEIKGGNTKAVRGTDVFTALADKADKSDVYSKSEVNTKLSAKLSNVDGSVHYTNLAADVFGKIEGGSLGAARGTDVFVGLSKKMDKSEIEQGTAPMTIDGYTKDDFYALNCRYQMVGDYCHITFTANPKVSINSPLVFSGLPFVAYNTSILGAYTIKNNPIKIEITNDTSNLTITKINGEPFAVGESSTFTIGHRIKS